VSVGSCLYRQESEMKTSKMNQILLAATCAIAIFGLVPPAEAQTSTCNLACEAFQWAYPVWRNAWSRFAHSADWSKTQTGAFTGNPSQIFAVNRILKRGATIPPTLTSPLPRPLLAALAREDWLFAEATRGT